MSRDEIRLYLENTLNLMPTRKTAKFHEYNLGGDVPFGLRQEYSSPPIAIAPDWLSKLRSDPLDGVFKPQLNRNSNYGPNFPKQEEGGIEQHTACIVEVADADALGALLLRLGVKIPASATEWADITATLPRLNLLPATERRTLIDARLGQGQFRDNLLRCWNSRCAVTGVAIPALLKASHIKPWRDSNDDERLDPDNGLLLVATLDAAFDCALMSFDDDGTVMFSPLLGEAPTKVLGISVTAALTKSPSLRQLNFLRGHRKTLRFA